jgi:hypothetical protein
MLIDYFGSNARAQVDTLLQLVLYAISEILVDFGEFGNAALLDFGVCAAQIVANVHYETLAVRRIQDFFPEGARLRVIVVAATFVAI